ncbi:MAG: hypothetical protein L0241_12230 [Planctomycetia bacterium]|nr:hypothetical protein [Planctomycetia bacterium]
MPRLLPERFATECIREFDLAATERYADAAAIVTARRRTAAIYLYGYVVEMLLKAAYFRLVGYGDADPIDVVALRAAVGESSASMSRTLGLPGTRNFHDLSAWVNLIVAYRASRSLVYAEAGFGMTLTAQVTVIDDRWTETIRYHKNTAYQHELDRVAGSCEWLVNHRYTI